MRKTLYIALTALVLCACAKKESSPLNETTKQIFDAWINLNYPGLRPTALGCYVVDEAEGEGAAIADEEAYPYLRVNYVRRTLDGTITDTNIEEVDKQLGDYDETVYYGPVVWGRGTALYAGIEESLADMRVGGTKKVVIPGWLMTYSRYDTVQGYLDNVSGTNAIVELELVEAIEDIEKWELDSLNSYMSRVYGVNPADTVKYGCFYRQLAQPATLEEFPDDTTIYINYTGRLLNGRVFDTTIRDTAKRYGLYDSSNEYEPVKIELAEDYTGITMGDSSSNVIDGFSYTISRMHEYEKGVGIFYSGLGYSASGSGDAIPAYSPLIFEIEIVDKPED